MNDQRKLRDLLETREFCITYSPLADEVSLGDIIPEHGGTYALSARATNDPLEEARQAVLAASGRSACVLIPGTRFDTLGTRHGRGGGWYDRFLAALPEAWPRIGVCFDDQLNAVPLIREPWDEPVDYVAVTGREDAALSLYATNARPSLSSKGLP